MPRSRKRTPLILVAALAVALTVTGLRAGDSRAADPSFVTVDNLLNPHPVEGTVGIRGTVRHGETERRRGVLVPPVGRSETNQLVSAGTVETDGFTTVTLSLVGEVRGDLLRPGRVGVILLPDEAPVREAFDQYGRIQLPLEATAPVAAGAAHFEGTEARLPVAFPRYRVLLYNTTDKTAAVNVYAYLSY